MSFFPKLGSLRSIVVGLAALVAIGSLTAVRLYFASRSRRRAEAPMVQQVPTGRGADRTKEAQAEKPVVAHFGEKFAGFVLPPEMPAKQQEKRPPPIPDDVRRQFVNQPTPISLFPPRLPAPPPPPAMQPTYYLPSFRLIRCELITGPQTGSIEIPLVGIVLDDQYNIDADGVSRVVVPAGVEVHGIGKPAPSRDRIDGGGKWTFVWRTKDGNNGMELAVNALALNRDYDQDRQAYGDQEKSPGIVGRRFESLGDQAIQEALLTSVAAVTRSVKSYASVLNPLTSQVVNEAKPTLGNALLEGGAAGMDRIGQLVDDIRKEIDEKGYYVAVLPGKEFYLYTREPIDLRFARRPEPLIPQIKTGTEAVVSSRASAARPAVSP